MLQSTERDLVLVEKEVSPIVRQATDMRVVSEDGKSEASEVLSKLNTWLDAVVEDREKITKPLNEALREVRGKYKPVESMLNEAISLVRGKIGAYQTQALKDKEDEEARIASRVKEGKGNLSFDSAVRQISEIEKPAEIVVGDTGTIKFRTTKKFEVVDVGLVPREYMVVNEPAIRKAMAEGRVVEGVRYYEEQTIVNLR